MQCISPMSIKRPGQDNPKNRITIPCGKCMACLSRKRNAWAFRLQNEAKDADTSVFITMTYDVENVPLSDKLVPTLCKRDIQLFMKRLRKMFPDCNLRYYIIGEYGPNTCRPHYHGLIFNLPFENKEQEVKLKNQLYTCWKKGFVMLGTVTEASIQYCTKYMITTNDDKKQYGYYNLEHPFALMSRRPGLGISYLSSEMIEYHNNSKIRRFYSVLKGGNKTALPRYYSDKIFNPEQKKRHLEEVQNEIDERYKEFLEKTPDAFNNELENKIQFTERTKNRLTKNTKL